MCPPFRACFPRFSRLLFTFGETSNERIYAGQYQNLKRRSLVAGAPSAGKSAKGKAKIEKGARELKLLALEFLALEAQLFPSRAHIETVLSDPALAVEATLWTYFHELERRAHFSSQGAPVHHLWREMNPTERQNLNAQRIWEARARLLEALQP